MFKVSNKTPELCRSYVFIVNFKHIPYLFVPVILLTFDMYLLLNIEKEHKLKGHAEEALVENNENPKARVMDLFIESFKLTQILH